MEEQQEFQNEEQQYEELPAVFYTSDRLKDACGLSAAIGAGAACVWLAIVVPFGSLLWGGAVSGVMISAACAFKQKEELLRDKSEVVTDEFPI